MTPLYKDSIHGETIEREKSYISIYTFYEYMVKPSGKTGKDNTRSFLTELVFF